MVEDPLRVAKLYFDRDMGEAEVLPVGIGQVVIYSARSPGKETPNEDSAALIPFDDRTGVLVIADGVGGVRAGEQASRVAVNALKTSLKQAAREEAMLRTAILNGFEEANRSVQKLGVGAATTLAAVEIQEDVIRPYHAGDSMILVTGQRSKIKLQTVPHSPVGFAVEAGFLDEAEAMHHEDRHLVSNLVGMPDMRIEIGSALKLAPLDTLILASDGLSDNLHIEEIVELVRRGPLDKAARRLAGEAALRMRQPDEQHPCKPDDITFAAFRLNPQTRRQRRKAPPAPLAKPA